jgi:hypothetical protein
MKFCGVIFVDVLGRENILENGTLLRCDEGLANIKGSLA